MDPNIFNLLEDDAEVPSIQKRVTQIHRSGIEDSELCVKSKVISNKKASKKIKGKQRSGVLQQKLNKKKRKSRLRAQAKNSN